MRSPWPTDEPARPVLGVPLSRRDWCRIALTAAGGLAAPRFLRADTVSVPSGCNRVEEDWELVIGEPDPDTVAPQIFNAIYPTSDRTGRYGLFEINHATQPEFREGMLQLQRWNGDVLRDYRTSAKSGLLTIPGEHVTYTMAMTLGGGQLAFTVKNGQSTTWGAFGGSELTLSSATLLGNFDGYSPSTSAAAATIGFAAHRVERFALLGVRYYKDSSLLATDSTVRVVYPVS